MKRVMRSGRAAIAFLGALAALGADWPCFRGPGGRGASEERGLPVRWTATENVLWKKQLPGPGASSPVVSRGRVFVTCYSGYGVGKGGRLEDLRRHLLCLDAKSGEMLWQRDVAAKLPEARSNRFLDEHGYASSTPAVDGERVYVFFGTTGTLAFDLDGKQLWQTPVGTDLNGWGSAASPLLYKGLVVINASVESSSLLALDRTTGKQVWKVKGVRDAWSTPVLVTLRDGAQELVISTPDALLGLDPDTGKKLWECEGVGGSASTSTPVAGGGVVYAMGSGPEGQATLAVRAGGRGDVTKTHLLWRANVSAGVTTPVLYGDHLFWVNGQAVCLRADTGKVVYRERLYEARPEYASAVVADGKLYAFTRQHGAYVLAATAKFERPAHNDLGDTSRFHGSPAVSDGRIYVRSDTYLYCIGANR